MISVFYILGALALLLLYGMRIARLEHLGIVIVSIAFSVASGLYIAPDTDIAVYNNIFQQMAISGFFAYNNDYLFWGLLYVFAISGLPFEFFYIAICFAINYLVLKNARDYLDNYSRFVSFCAIYFCSTSFIFFQSNILRQGLAFALLSAAFYCRSPGFSKKMLLVLPVHFSAAFVFVYNNLYVMLGAAAVFVLYAIAPFNLDLWIFDKAQSLSEKTSELNVIIYLVFAGYFGLFLATGRKEWLGVSLLLVVFMLLPYIGYRLQFYLQAPLIAALCATAPSRAMLPIAILVFVVGGFFVYTNNSVLILTETVRLWGR